MSFGEILLVPFTAGLSLRLLSQAQFLVGRYAELPSLGPHVNMAEHLVEKYNRAYCLLRGFSQILEPGRWTSKVSGPEATPFESILVDPSYVPSWMIQVDTASAAASIPKRSPTRMLPPKKTNLSWDHNPKLKSMQAVT